MNQYLLKVTFKSAFHLPDIKPPKGCTCINSTSVDDKYCYDAPAKCGAWDEKSKYNWCYVADESSCKVKKQSYCGGLWTQCEESGKLESWPFLVEI